MAPVARATGQIALAVFLFAACATDPTVAETDVDENDTLGAVSGSLPDGPSALEDMNDPDFPDPLIDPGDVISGGPPPDGIPSIDEPHFVGVDEADAWLDAQESVVALEIGDDARAYPVQILMWHEIVNDTVGGVPVAVTYCPLCNTAISFERTINGVETTFGTSGRLYASALVMYDRATESLWTHFDGRAVIGVLSGHRLEIVPAPLLAWEEFAAAHPDGRVLDRERTGYTREYGRNPYARYDDPDGFPFLLRGFDVDDRSAAMQRVVGVEQGGETKAWTLEVLARDGRASVTSGSVGGEAVVIFWKPGQASALEHGLVASGRDVGSVGVFRPEIDGERLDVRAEGDDFVDEQTGSTWNVAGHAVEGSLEGRRLERLHHFDTFWFAWSTYRPETVLVTEADLDAD